jgi:hypothetical protein
MSRLNLNELIAYLQTQEGYEMEAKFFSHFHESEATVEGYISEDFVSWRLFPSWVEDVETLPVWKRLKAHVTSKTTICTTAGQ